MNMPKCGTFLLELIFSLFKLSFFCQMEDMDFEDFWSAALVNFSFISG